MLHVYTMSILMSELVTWARAVFRNWSDPAMALVKVHMRYRQNISYKIWRNLLDNRLPTTSQNNALFPPHVASREGPFPLIPIINEWVLSADCALASVCTLASDCTLATQCILASDSTLASVCTLASDCILASNSILASDCTLWYQQRCAH